MFFFIFSCLKPKNSIKKGQIASPVSKSVKNFHLQSLLLAGIGYFNLKKKKKDVKLNDEK
jgi:hypothetical protein